MNDELSPGSIALEGPGGSHLPTAIMWFLHAPAVVAGISSIVSSATLLPNPLLLDFLQLP